MIGKVFYQDFELNVNAHCGNDDALVLDEDNAQFMAKFISNSLKSKEEFSNEIFQEMNIGDTLETGIVRVAARKIGHTSMSIGDYIKFEDGTILVCKSIGWKIFPAK
jgi:hypothetical protein